MKMIIHTPDKENQYIRDFQEIIDHLNLCYTTRDLFAFGIVDFTETEQAVERAIKICSALQIPLKRHFKAIYICKEGHLIKEWQLSEMALKLVILNADAANPVVANLQLKLINQADAT